MANVKFRQGSGIMVALVGTCGSVKVANPNVGACGELAVGKKSACGCHDVANYNFGACAALTMAKIV